MNRVSRTRRKVIKCNRKQAKKSEATVMCGNKNIGKKKNAHINEFRASHVLCRFCISNTDSNRNGIRASDKIFLHEFIKFDTANGYRFVTLEDSLSQTHNTTTESKSIIIIDEEKIVCINHHSILISPRKMQINWKIVKLYLPYLC